MNQFDTAKVFVNFLSGRLTSAVAFMDSRVNRCQQQSMWVKCLNMQEVQNYQNKTQKAN